MDIIKINRLIDTRDYNGLKIYINNNLCGDNRKNLILLNTVNTLLFNKMFRLYPEECIEIFNETSTAIVCDDYCLEFIERYYEPDIYLLDVDDPAISKAVKYINENLNQELSLDSVASYLGISRNYLSNLFKLKTGTRFSRYINVQRIKKSKALLSFSGLSMEKIAKKCGFNSQSHFSTTFLRLEGQTPSEYRKNTNMYKRKS